MNPESLPLQRKTTISVCLLQNEAVDNANLSEIELTIGVSRTNTFILPIKPDHLSGYVQRLQAFLLQLRFLFCSKIAKAQLRALFEEPKPNLTLTQKI